MIRRLGARFRYALLPQALRHLPWVAWRLPAVLLGTARWLLQGEVRAAMGPALAALGRPATRLARWRLGWLIAYHEEAHHLLTVQGEKLTDAWIARRVRRDGALPPGGAVLIALHQHYTRLGYWRLRVDGVPLGMVASEQREAWDPAHPDYPAERDARGDRDDYYARRWRIVNRLLDGHLYRPPGQLRAAARFVQAGGALIVMPDGFTFPVWERGNLLGKAIPLAPGPVWLARRTGKPLVPFMVIPGWRGWRIWLGAPIVPTQEGVAAALTDCLRRSPASLHGAHWRAWQQAPTWDEWHSRREEGN